MPPRRAAFLAPPPSKTASPAPNAFRFRPPSSLASPPFSASRRRASRCPPPRRARARAPRPRAPPPSRPPPDVATSPDPPPARACPARAACARDVLREARAPASSRPEASASPPRKVTRNVFFPIHATCHGAPKPAATNLGVSALIERSSATPVKTTTPARVGVSGCAPHTPQDAGVRHLQGNRAVGVGERARARRPTNPRGGNAP